MFYYEICALIFLSQVSTSPQHHRKAQHFSRNWPTSHSFLEIHRNLKTIEVEEDVHFNCTYDHSERKVAENFGLKIEGHGRDHWEMTYMQSADSTCQKRNGDSPQWEKVQVRPGTFVQILIIWLRLPLMSLRPNLRWQCDHVRHW